MELRSGPRLLFGRLGYFLRDAKSVSDDKHSEVWQKFFRSQFVQLITDCDYDSILEIGPLNRAMMSGFNVDYFYLLPTDKLKAKAVMEGLEPNLVPEITYSHPTGDLRVVDKNYSAVISSHYIEHQPDLIRHLKSVETLFQAGGIYADVIQIVVIVSITSSQSRN